MKRGKIGRCPYCGRFLNYFFLWGCKKNDIGTCNHCGGVFAVKYSFLAYVLFVVSIIAFGCTFGYYYLATQSWPETLILLAFLAFFFVFYFVLPMLIQPRKCIINGRLGGFPNKESIPKMKRKLFFEHPDEGMEPLDEAREEEFVPNNLIVGLEEENPNGNTSVVAQTAVTKKNAHAERENEAERAYQLDLPGNEPQPEEEPIRVKIPQKKAENKIENTTAETPKNEPVQKNGEKTKAEMLFEELFGEESKNSEEYEVYNDLPAPGEKKENKGE